MGAIWPVPVPTCFCSHRGMSWEAFDARDGAARPVQIRVARPMVRREEVKNKMQAPTCE
eukprot:CAMPEP_0184465866 /NCGR_PEP_ID=MMETSP0740-20130409/63695_1 /TAXON_ID=385413 /ORGANISM="Thalassiosira miniscula, Strain CCMP1093" /LENGTH=58 /DNA_ID=CAMNT_0026840799 /DNA_START=46 /DNA_END=219 /DNA_ORIENTATION=-